MTIPKEILDAYQKYSQEFGDAEAKFPYGTEPDNFGGLHLEVKSDGSMALVGTERGSETLRQETDSIDEPMYRIFKSRASSRAFFRKQEKYDYKASQKIALDEIGKISNQWRERLRQEQIGFHPKS